MNHVVAQQRLSQSREISALCALGRIRIIIVPVLLALLLPLLRPIMNDRPHRDRSPPRTLGKGGNCAKWPVHSRLTLVPSFFFSFEETKKKTVGDATLAIEHIIRNHLRRQKTKISALSPVRGGVTNDAQRFLISRIPLLQNFVAHSTAYTILAFQVAAGAAGQAGTMGVVYTGPAKPVLGTHRGPL